MRERECLVLCEIGSWPTEHSCVVTHHRYSYECQNLVVCRVALAVTEEDALGYGDVYVPLPIMKSAQLACVTRVI